MKNLFFKDNSFEDFVKNFDQTSTLISLEEVRNSVSLILKEIKLRKDDALISFSKKFDNYDCNSIDDLTFSKDNFKDAYDSLDKEIIVNLEFLKERILNFHSKIPLESWSYEDEAFSSFGQIVRPIKRVGLYAPGGTAIYPSSILMTAVLASLAGVKEIILAFPPCNAELTKLMLATAHIGGVSEAISIGGAQSIGAMAFGTESIKKVDKIFGPGNQYVAEAKRQVYGLVGIDSLTGPSEVMIIADQSANPEFVAADLLAQAEHGVNSACFLVSIGPDVKNNVLDALKAQLENIDRSEIVLESFKKYSYLIEARDLSQAKEVCNLIHPEHLQIILDNASEIVLENFSAGAIFVGASNTAVLGDYCAGPSHVIPTSGASRFSSQVSIRDFFTTSSFTKISENFDSEELQKVISNSIDIANLEGLSAHAKALELRLKKSNSN
ncbi:histidinol dehydrogenase [SAR86 cluster bacterium]|nr:histidinol dehydrogenase [SAR86 cluster bacterium]